MADEAPAAPVATEAAVEAPASEFTLESAFTQALAQAEPSTDAPKAGAQESKAASTPTAETESDTPAGEEPKSNRQAGKEAYERGLREGQERARQTAEAERTRIQAEQQTQNQTREFEDLLQKAQQGDLTAADRVISLMTSHRATQAAMLQGRNTLLAEMGTQLSQSIATLEGADAETKAALMQAPSVADFGKQAFDHGRRIEKSLWEPEIAKRDATIEQLRGQVASRRPSPESANGLRTNGAATFDGSWESAFAMAQASARAS